MPCEEIPLPETKGFATSRLASQVAFTLLSPDLDLLQHTPEGRSMANLSFVNACEMQHALEIQI